VHLDGRIQDPVQHTHGLEDFERTGQHANGFRVLRRLEKRVDDAAVDAASGQLDGCGKADGPGSGDEDLGLQVGGHD